MVKRMSSLIGLSQNDDDGGELLHNGPNETKGNCTLATDQANSACTEEFARCPDTT
jgi:hypothetical protein